MLSQKASILETLPGTTESPLTPAAGPTQIPPRIAVRASGTNSCPPGGVKDTRVAARGESPAHLTDEELLTRLQKGEWHLFAILVRRYESALFHYLWRKLGDYELAEDVFQTTFTQVFAKIRQYEPGRPAKPWLYRIATHQAIDAHRARLRRQPHQALSALAPLPDAASMSLWENLPGSEAEPVKQLETAELQQAIRRAVQELPQPFQEVIQLAYFEGLKYQEIAEVLAIPLGTVKSRLHKAMSKLAEAWQEIAARSDPDSPTP